MIGRRPGNEDYVPGFRFVTGGWARSRYDRYGSTAPCAKLLHEVTTREGSTFTTKDHLGGVHEGRLRWSEGPDMGKDPAGSPQSVVWADPLPNAPFEQIAILADVLLQFGWRERPYMLLCDDVADDGSASCRLVHTEGRGALTDGRRGHPEGEVRPGRAIGGAYVLDEIVTVRGGIDEGWYGFGERPEPYAPKKGDLFLALKVRATEATPPIITSASLVLVAEHMDDEAVGRWLPEERPREGRMIPTDISIADRDDLEEEIEKGFARREPDEIIVIMVPKSDGDTHAKHLSRTGIQLHDIDSIDDDLWSSALDSGVWLGTDIGWADCGEDGAEWYASWRRATMEDMERHGVSLEEAAEWWAEYEEGDAITDETGIAAIIATGLAKEAAERTAQDAVDASRNADEAPKES